MCANVSEERYRNTLLKEHRTNWKCQEYICKQRKSGNANTPVSASKISAHKATNNFTSGDSESGRDDTVSSFSNVTHQKRHSSTVTDKAPNVQLRLVDFEDDRGDPTQFSQIPHAS